MKYLLMTIMIVCCATICTWAQEDNDTLRGTVKVQVDGLSCPFCAYGLEKGLKELEGVKSIEVDIENAIALLTIEEGKLISKALIRQTILDAGFTPRKIVEVKEK